MKTVIHNMLNILQEYKSDSKDQMETLIQERLTKSFNEYDKELQQSILFLTRKHEKSLMKRLKKVE